MNIKCYDISHRSDVVRESELAPTLAARMGTGGGNVPIVLQENGNDRAISEEIAPPLRTTVPPIVLMDQGGGVMGIEENKVGTLRAQTHGHEPVVCVNETSTVAQRYVVRKLTPLECERLQGFPDDYTRVPYRRKAKEQCPDNPRYEAIGNSWAVPVVRWIGMRIHKAVYG